VNYSESQVNDFLEQLLALRSSGPVYRPHVKNGQLRYRSCIPHQHQIVDRGEVFNVTAADDTVMVGVHVATGETKLFYPHELGSLSIIDKPPVTDTPIELPDLIGRQGTDMYPALSDTLRRYVDLSLTGEETLPALCGIYTHHTNNISYLVYGFTNESSRDDKRDEYPLLVHYVGQNGKTWSKTVKRFNETMIAGGKFQFNADAGFKYLGIVENDQIVNGWLTKDLGLLMATATAPVTDSDNDQTED
jgi:hypothetical protein